MIVTSAPKFINGKARIQGYYSNPVITYTPTQWRGFKPRQRRWGDLVLWQTVNLFSGFTISFPVYLRKPPSKTPTSGFTISFPVYLRKPPSKTPTSVKENREPEFPPTKEGLAKNMAYCCTGSYNNTPWWVRKTLIVTCEVFYLRLMSPQVVANFPTGSTSSAPRASSKKLFWSFAFSG